MDTTFAADPVSCYAHVDVASTVECARCDRHLCDVCAFESAAGKLCVDCMSEGAGHSDARKTIGYSVAALVCASLGVVTLGIPFFGLQDAVGLGPGFLGVAAFLCFGGGLAFAVSGRDHSRRTGSPLALIGMIANGTLLALYVVLCIIGSVR